MSLLMSAGAGEHDGASNYRAWWPAPSRGKCHPLVLQRRFIRQGDFRKRFEPDNVMG